MLALWGSSIDDGSLAFDLVLGFIVAGKKCFGEFPLQNFWLCGAMGFALCFVGVWLMFGLVGLGSWVWNVRWFGLCFGLWFSKLRYTKWW